MKGLAEGTTTSQPERPAEQLGFEHLVAVIEIIGSRSIPVSFVGSVIVSGAM